MLLNHFSMFSVALLIKNVCHAEKKPCKIRQLARIFFPLTPMFGETHIVLSCNKGVWHNNGNTSWLQLFGANFDWLRKTRLEERTRIFALSWFFFQLANNWYWHKVWSINNRYCNNGDCKLLQDSRKKKRKERKSRCNICDVEMLWISFKKKEKKNISLSFFS